MAENTDWKHGDVEEFEVKVEESEDVNLDSTLKGAPMGTTVGDLLEVVEENADAWLITSTRSSVPIPLGASFEVDSLHDFADVIETLGPNCIEEVEKVPDDALKVGFHFD